MVLDVVGEQIVVADSCYAKLGCGRRRDMGRRSGVDGPQPSSWEPY